SGAINSSFWPYYARFHRPWPLPEGKRVTVPTADAAFPREILLPPRAWAERAYNIQRWTVMPAGGHFAALEAPEALTADTRGFFRPPRCLRCAGAGEGSATGPFDPRPPRAFPDPSSRGLTDEAASF